MQFAASELALAGITESHVHSLDMEVVEPLARHASTVFALRASVTSQRSKRANHVAANCAIQRDSVRNPNHEEQVAKADRCLNEYVAASNRLDEDYCRYQQERHDELLLLLHSLANLQVQHCQNSQVVWTELVESLSEGGAGRGPSSRAQSRRAEERSQSPGGCPPPCPPPMRPSSLLDLDEEDNEERVSDFYESV